MRTHEKLKYSALDQGALRTRRSRTSGIVSSSLYPPAPASMATAAKAKADGDAVADGAAAAAAELDPHEYPKHLRLPLTIAYCAIVAFNVAFCMGLRGPALLRVAEQIGLVSLTGSSADDVDLSQLTEMGLANMAFTGVSALFSVFITGAIVDRMPRFHLLTFAMCELLAFLSLSVIWIDAAWQLIFISALMGMCLSAISKCQPAPLPRSSSALARRSSPT